MFQTAYTYDEKLAAQKAGTQDTIRRQILDPRFAGRAGQFQQLINNPWYLSPTETGTAKKDKLTDEYQTAYNEAKAANLKRYEEVLAGYKTRYGTAMEGLAKSRTEIMSGLEGMGQEELAGIGRQYTKERASVSQQLISSGLHSTTVAPSVLGGVTRREGYAVGEAQERLRRERLGYLQQLSDKELMMQTGMTKEELDFMERREDEYPSESLYVQLMQGLGGS